MKRLFLMVALLILPWMARQSLAHGFPFFEFSPDYYASEGLSVASSDALAEIFIPQNDFLGGIDLWFDNVGLEGSAIFELFDNGDSLVLSKGVNISHLDPMAGGERFHLDFLQIPVSAIKKYTLKISATIPELQIYYSNRIKFLQHNASYISEYLNGVARVGNEEKEFSFKFALYEGLEHTPPLITNLNFTALGEGKVRLDFNSNEAVDHAIFWGLPGGGYTDSLPFSGSYLFCGQGIVFCTSVLRGAPGQTYNYQLTAKDSWGNERNLTGTFTIPSETTETPVPTSAPTESPRPTPLSLGENDNAAPVIANLRISEVTDHAVEIAWQTNEAADSSLLVSFTTELLTIAAANDSTLELEHVLSSGPILNPSTPYKAVVTSRDAYNNMASASLNFKTLPASSVPTPALSATPSFIPNPWLSFGPSVSSVVQPEGGGGVAALPSQDEKGTVVISWTSPQEEIKEYRIDIFNDKHELARTLIVPAGIKEIKVADLPDGEYQAVVYANDKGVMRKVAPPVTFVIGQRALEDKLFALWPYLAGPLVITLLLVLRYIRKKAKKKSL